MDSIGCINDFCQKKKDVMLKLRTADICDSCLRRAEGKNVDILVMDQLSRTIRALREQFINSYSIESKVKPENVYVDPVSDQSV